MYTLICADFSSSFLTYNMVSPSLSGALPMTTIHHWLSVPASHEGQGKGRNTLSLRDGVRMSVLYLHSFAIWKLSSMFLFLKNIMFNNTENCISTYMYYKEYYYLYPGYALPSFSTLDQSTATPCISPSPLIYLFIQEHLFKMSITYQALFWALQNTVKLKKIKKPWLMELTFYKRKLLFWIWVLSLDSYRSLQAVC